MVIAILSRRVVVLERQKTKDELELCRHYAAWIQVLDILNCQQIFRDIAFRMFIDKKE